MIRQYEIASGAILPLKEEQEILDKYHRAILENQDLKTKDKNILIGEAVSKLQKYNPNWNKKEVNMYFKNAEKKNKKALISSNPSLVQYQQHNNAQGMNQMPMTQQVPMIPNPFQSNNNFVTPQNSQMQALQQAQQKPQSKKGKKEAEEASKPNINPTQFYPPNMANGEKLNQPMKAFPQQFNQPINNVQMAGHPMGQAPQFNPQMQVFQPTQTKKGKKSKDTPQQMPPNQMPINSQPLQGQVQLQQQQSQQNTFQMANPAQQVILNGQPMPAQQTPQKGKRKGKKDEKVMMTQAPMMNPAMYQFNPQQQMMQTGSKMGFNVPMQPSQQQIPLNQTPSQMMQIPNQMQQKTMQQSSQQLMQYPPNGMMPQKISNQTFMNIPQQPQTPPKRTPKSKRGQSQTQEVSNQVQQESIILPPEAKAVQKADQSPKRQKQRNQETVINETKQKTRASRRQKANDSNDDDDDDE